MLVAVVLAKFCMGCNFAGAALANADFSGAFYVGSNFDRAQLTGASFHGARMIAANFHNADLRGARFEDVDCLACNFAGASLDRATFSHVRFTAANFVGFAAAVDDVSLRELLSGCIACNFSRGILAGRDLSGLPLISVDFSHTDLSGATLSGAVLCWYDGNALPRRTKCDQMNGAALAGAKLDHVQVCVDPLARSGCEAVTPDELRRESGAQLDGAILVQ
ncbi:MAG TPA: pentapeptide repeat-containing protein [Candidatus Cybelea sp.]